MKKEKKEKKKKKIVKKQFSTKIVKCKNCYFVFMMWLNVIKWSYFATERQLVAFVRK